MRTCPRCGTTYTDDGLRYCLSDGAELGAPVASGARPTEVYSGAETEQATQLRPPLAPVPPSGGSSNGLLKVLIAVALVAVLALAGIAALGGFGAIYYFAGGGDGSPSPSPSRSMSPTPDAEKERLEEELANLRRKVDEQKSNSADDLPFPDDAVLKTATVNSPRDGFLAIRSQPSEDYGERLAKVPHGSDVLVTSCLERQVQVAGRSGRWCLVVWEDHAGWAFDGFLNY